MLKKEMCYMSAENPSTKNISGSYIFFVKRASKNLFKYFKLPRIGTQVNFITLGF